MEGEWGPTDKGSSVVDDSLHIHISHLCIGGCTDEDYIQQVNYYRGSNFPYPVAQIYCV